MPVYKSDTPTKDGRHYYFMVSYVDNNGNQQRYKSKRYAGKRECVKAEAEFKARIGEYLSGASMTFNDAAVEFLAEMKLRLKPEGYKDVANYVRHVTNLMGKLKIEKLTAAQYQKFINDVRSLGFTTNVSNRILATAKRLVKHASLMHGVNSSIPYQFSPLKDPEKKPNTFNIYTYEQFKTFSSVIDDPMYKTLFDVLFFCGLRKGEICALSWSDIDLTGQTISITKSVNTSKKEKTVSTPKTLSSNRTIPISADLCRELTKLKTMYQQFPRFSNDWFVFGGLSAIPNNTLQMRKKKYYQLAKQVDPDLPEIRIHDFRHSCASFLINEIKAPITSISRYLGHENPQITLSVYSHFYEKDLSMIASEIEKIQKKCT